MLAYIARRLLLMIPTLFGIMLISFVIVQFAPGGPVERIIAQLQGRTPARPRASRAAAATSPAAPGRGRGGRRRTPTSSRYRGAQGLDPQFIKQLEQQFGFDKPAHERFVKMLWDYARFDFGKSYFRDVLGAAADQGEAAGLDHARPVDDAPLLRDLDPARHPQGGARRLRLRRLDLRRRHRRLRHPGLPVRDPAHRALRRRLVLADLPAARPHRRTIGASSRCGARSSTTSGTSPCRSSPWRSAPSRPRRC